MKCVHCGYDRVPATAAFCPKCGQPMPAQTQVRVKQRTEDLQGKMVGVDVQGDVYGGEFRTVQVFVLSAAGRAQGAKVWDQFLKANTPPYKFLAPYMAQERSLFFGRDDEIADVVRCSGEGRVVVLSGPAGVGKTSLLAAGVIPQLMEWGALTLCLGDYGEPLENGIREALSASTEAIRLRLPEKASLPKLVQAIAKGTRGSLVLVLDQFERFFQPPINEAQRMAFIGSLAQTLQEVEPEYFRVILAVREDAWPRLAALGEQLPGGLQNTARLAPLTRSGAEAAIVRPLATLQSRVSYVGDLVPMQLVPDLDELTPDTLNAIQPAHLQIVCSRLHEATHQREPPLIDADLYVRKAKGASGIMATYAEDMLREQLADQQALAKRVLATLAARRAGEWTPAEQIPADGASPDQVHGVLRRLVEMQLLIDRAVDSRYDYGFSSPSVVNAVRSLADPQVKGRVQAGEELERIWTRWLAYLDKPQYDALAGRGQLRYLAEVGGHLQPTPVQTLLLLRSAVSRDEPAGPWQEMLSRDRHATLIRQLETPEAVSAEDAATLSTLDKAERLLGLQDVQAPQGKSYGRVAYAAVNHHNPKARQTAALALSVLSPGDEEGLERVDRALRDMEPGPLQRGRVTAWQRRSRRGELHGALADASPEIEEKIRKRDADLPRLDRMWIEWWRARRRIVRDWQRIVVLTLGGAIGAGLGYGLLRSVSAAIIRLTVGMQFFIQSYVGAILGAALTLGLILAEYLTPASPAARDEVSGGQPAPISPQGPERLAAIGFGALLFGMAQSTIAALIGLSLIGAPLVAPLGFVAGLGLSLAVQGQPRAGWRLGLGQWLQRLGAATLAFLCTQLVFILSGVPEGGIAIVWRGQLYHSELNRYLWWNRMVTAQPQWKNYVSLLDAALVGIVLAIGTTAGLRLAARWLAKWHDVVSQLGD